MDVNVLERRVKDSIKAQNYTDLETRRIWYSLCLLGSECSKFLIMLVLFSLFGLKTELLVCISVLLPLRALSGGLHFDHYLSCLASTLCMIVTGVALARIVPPNVFTMYVCFPLCIVLTYMLGPVPSKYRPPMSRRNKNRFRKLACMFQLILMYLCVGRQPSTYMTMCFWLVVMHALQLTVAYVMSQKGGYHEKIPEQLS